MALLQSYSGWRKTWSYIIPGHVRGTQRVSNLLLFYDRIAGASAFYQIHDSGNLTLVKQYDDWRKSCTQIVQSNFTSKDESGFLFYDANAGVGEIYGIDSQGNITLLQHYDGWRSSWTAVIPGAYGGPGYSDLLFYDSSAGQIVFYTVDCADANISLMNELDGWGSSWAEIGGASMLPQNVGGQGLNAGQTHELLAPFVEPIGASILAIVTGVLSGGNRRFRFLQAVTATL
jgi:hypothetical protein